MRCQNCDYRLWGVTGRDCPECGTAFLPSQFEFVPHSVRFCCPHCGQEYYGTADRGHLSPSEFTCVGCGQWVRMDEMTLFPTAGIEEEQTKVELMPWLERRDKGFFGSWLKTIFMGACAPVRLTQLTPPGSSLASAFWFAALTAGLATITGTLPLFIFPFLMAGLPTIGAFGAGGVALIAALVWPSILILVWGGCAHLVLRLTGRTEYGFARTCQAMGYSSGPTVLMGVPCLGLYLIPVAWIWWSITAILTIREGQRAGRLRSATAVLSLPVLSLTALALAIIYMFIPLIQSARQSAGASMQQATLGMLNSGIISHAGKNNGRPPAHAAELLAADTSLAGFMRSGQGTSPKVFVAGVDLKQFLNLPRSRQQALAQAAAGKLPPGVAAHRLGDFVFTYHGINFNKPLPALWVVALAPEAPLGTPASRITVGLADGTTTTITPAAIPKALAAQNALRAANGLAPLPDLRLVTQTQPAVATSTAPDE